MFIQFSEYTMVCTTEMSGTPEQCLHLLLAGFPRMTKGFEPFLKPIYLLVKHFYTLGITFIF